jgi:hypothetical protein
MHIEPPTAEWEGLEDWLFEQVAEALSEQHMQDLARVHQSFAEIATPPLLVAKVLQHVQAMHRMQVEDLAEQLHAAHARQHSTLH